LEGASAAWMTGGLDNRERLRKAANSMRKVA